MSITQKDVEKIAHLARINLSNQTNQQSDSNTIPFADSIAKDLNAILTLIEQINEVDTEAMTPMAHPLDSYQRLRTDVIDQPNVRESALNLVDADAQEAGLYLVPKVIEE